MSRLFVSHSSNNDEWALALRDWLVREGWSGADDIFLDFDPQHGIAAGERWRSALETAATRCEAVLCLISTDWLASKWCHEEYELASRLNKKLFALLIDDTRPDELPDGLSATWQLIRLKGDPAASFAVAHPRRWINRHFVVQVAEAGLKSLKRGLDSAAGLRSPAADAGAHRQGHDRSGRACANRRCRGGDRAGGGGRAGRCRL